MKHRRESESGREPEVLVRQCTPADLGDAAKLAARLVREHHALDPQRFFTFDNIEAGYAAYLRGELGNKQAVVLVAVQANRVAGYAYGRIEPRDWSALRDSCGFLHDVYVDESSRRQGIASLLVEEMAQRLAALGAPRVMLMTAAQNSAAQQLFRSLGFRTTMLEMTKECVAKP